MHDAAPLISIVTPSYNQGVYIEQTVRSVIDQAGENLEYVVVDGGSTDHTKDVLARLEGHPRVSRIISEPDRGQTDALIKGFAACTGDVFGWLNSDDLLTPGALETVCAAFREHPDADVVCGRIRFINSRGEDLGLAPRTPMRAHDWLRTTMAISQQCTFFRAAAYRRVGGLDPTIHHVMDYDLFMRLALQGCAFHYIPETLALFRLHDTSKTIGTPWKLWREELRVFRRHGGHPFSPFYYWKAREVLSFFIKRKLLKLRRY